MGALSVTEAPPVCPLELLHAHGPAQQSPRGDNVACHPQNPMPLRWLRVTLGLMGLAGLLGPLTALCKHTGGSSYKATSTEGHSLIFKIEATCLVGVAECVLWARRGQEAGGPARE